MSTDSNTHIINVVGAAIISDGRVLCAQRGPGRSLAGYWEFPGGKIKDGESAEQALRREIHEELRCRIAVGHLLTTTIHTYDFATIRLSVFLCHLEDQTPTRTEHSTLSWMTPAQMRALSWAPADQDAARLIITGQAGIDCGVNTTDTAYTT